MLKPMNLQLFAEPGDPVPTSEPTPAAGKTYSEDYVTALRGESANYRTRAKSYEGALRTVLGLKDGEELGDLNARLSAYQQNQTKQQSAALEAANKRLIGAEMRTLEGYDHKLLEKLIDLSNVKVSSIGRSRYGLFTPACVGVPFCWAICSAVCSSIYAFPSSMRRMAKSHNCWK